MGIDKRQISAFEEFLWKEERARATVEKYLREVLQFAAWLQDEPINKEAVARWKEFLLTRKKYRPSTINGKLTALDRFFSFLGQAECRVKHLRLQRQLFREDKRELSQKEYQKLIGTAYAEGKERLGLLMETICSTGIRVSEVRYITLEAVEQGRAEISLKGKIRIILIPGKLRRKLIKYSRQRKILFGEIFLTKSGRSLSRKQIWAEMKRICRKAGVEESKVFPHNLRHLFARMFYQVSRDITKLADVLGHSSIDTTRIYLVSTGYEHTKILDKLRLIL